MRWRKGFWWALCSAASEVAGSPDSLAPCQLAFEALDCLCHFAGDRLNCGRVVKQALLLPLLLLVVPTEAMIEDENRKVEMGREPNLRYKALQQVGHDSREYSRHCNGALRQCSPLERTQRSLLMCAVRNVRAQCILRHNLHGGRACCILLCRFALIGTGGCSGATHPGPHSRCNCS